MQKQLKTSKSRMKILHSLSFTTRMLLLILVLLIITTITFMLITQYEAEKTIERTISTSIQDMRSLISLYVDNQYRSLVFHRENVLNRYKQKLKDLTDLVLANIRYYHQLAQKKILSEEDAREFALRSIEQFRYGNNDYFFVYNEDNVAISHPDPEIRGKNMTEYQDLKGNYPLKLIRKTILEKGEGYNSFWHIRLEEEKPIEKLTYSTYYEPWGWVIGTGFYIDDLEYEYRENLEEMLSEFRKTFSKIRIGTNGYFFIFNTNHIVLVHPTMEGVDFAEVDVPGMGMEHWYNMERASKNPDDPYIYYWDKPGYENDYSFKKIAYVDYFEPLNWYIVSTFYEDELNEPVKNIFRKELFTALAAILISGILTYFAVKKFTKPIKVLTRHAQHLTKNNFVSDNNKELKALAERSQNECPISQTLLSGWKTSFTHIFKISRKQQQQKKKFRVSCELLMIYRWVCYHTLIQTLESRRTFSWMHYLNLPVRLAVIFMITSSSMMSIYAFLSVMSQIKEFQQHFSWQEAKV